MAFKKGMIFAMFCDVVPTTSIIRCRGALLEMSANSTSLRNRGSVRLRYEVRTSVPDLTAT